MEFFKFIILRHELVKTQIKKYAQPLMYRAFRLARARREEYSYAMNISPAGSHRDIYPTPAGLRLVCSHDP